MATEAQDHPNRHNAPKINLCSTLSLPKGLPCVAFCEAGPSTTVENPLQINLFMQNKANFRKSQMNVNPYNTTYYERKRNWTLGESKPNSNPIKPNLKRAKMNVNLTLTKGYRKKDDFVVRINKPNSKPKQTQTKPIDMKRIKTTYSSYINKMLI